MYQDECYFYYTFYHTILLGSSAVLVFFAFNEFSFQTFLYRYLSRLERNEIVAQLEEIREHLQHLKHLEQVDVPDDASTKSIYSDIEPEKPKQKSTWSKFF